MTRPIRRPVGQGVRPRPVPGTGSGPSDPAAAPVDPASPDAARLAPVEPTGAESTGQRSLAETPGTSSASVGASHASAVQPTDLLLVGRVLDAYGIRGWVKVEPYNHPEESVLREIRRWWLQAPARGPAGVRSAARAGMQMRDVERVRAHGAVLVAKPRSCEDRDAALSLKGLEIHASRADFPAGDDDEFYWHDLVGCEVYNPAGQALGRVFAVEDYGAHPLLRLRPEEGPERMIPFIDVYVLSVDLAGRRIVADWALDY